MCHELVQSVFSWGCVSGSTHLKPLMQVGVVGVACCAASLHLVGQILGEVVQTRSLALRDVAAAKGTRFAKVIVVIGITSL